MEFKNVLSVKNRDELRQWLLENHKRESECWVVVKRGRPVDNGTFWYIDAVEESMCFGWIDSTTKKMENGMTMVVYCKDVFRKNITVRILPEYGR